MSAVPPPVRAVLRHVAVHTVRNRAGRPFLAPFDLDAPVEVAGIDPAGLSPVEDADVSGLGLMAFRHGEVLSGTGRLWERRWPDRPESPLAPGTPPVLRPGREEAIALELRAFDALARRQPTPEAITRALARASARAAEGFRHDGTDLLRDIPHPLLWFRAAVVPYWGGPGMFPYEIPGLLPCRLDADGKPPHLRIDDAAYQGAVDGCARRIRAATPGMRQGMQDVVDFANHAPQTMALLLRGYGVPTDRTRELEEALWPFVEASATGSVAGDDLAPACEAVRAAAIALEGRIPGRSARARTLSACLAFVETVARPALAPQVPDEDAACLGGLAP